MFEGTQIVVYDEIGVETIRVRYYTEDSLLKIGRHAIGKEDMVKLRDFINQWIDPQ